MLNLTRRVGQSIIIGDNIKVTILGFNNSAKNQIQVGIEAPREITVHREEIYKRIQKERQAEKLNKKSTVPA